MTIHGLQKMTLLDYPGRVACTVFTAGCNFRCPFCHNARLVTTIDPAEAYDEEEVLSFLKKRVGLLDGVCFTGGEPLLQKDIEGFMRKVRKLGYLIKLDTNGSFPDRLRSVIDAGLVDYVAMDIKNRREKYALTAGFSGELLPAIEQSIALLMEGRVQYEFRTTVMNELHTVEDMASIGAWIRGADRYFIQSFTDSGELVGQGTYTAPDTETLLQMLAAVKPHVPAAALRGV